MKNEKKVKKDQVLKEKEWYRKEIMNLVNNIESTWILNQIKRFIENITR